MIITNRGEEAIYKNLLNKIYILEMYRMLVNHKFRLHVTTNSNFRTLILLLFQYFPNIASRVILQNILPTIWRDKSMHYRKWEKFKFLDRRLCSKQSQYIINSQLSFVYNCLMVSGRDPPKNLIWYWVAKTGWYSIRCRLFFDVYKKIVCWTFRKLLYRSLIIIWASFYRLILLALNRSSHLGPPVAL